jgi:hypothetical protein
VVGKIWFRYLRIPAGRFPVEVTLVDDRAPQGGPVSADHLGERIHRDVRAEIKGVEERRRRHRIVDDERQLVLVGYPGDGREIVHVPFRIPDGLRVEQPGVLVDGPLEVGRVARVDEASLDPEALERVAELSVGAAVELVPGHEVLPGRGNGGDGVEDGRLSGSGRHRARRAVDGGQPLLEHVSGGVHEPRVDIAERSQGKKVGRVTGVAEHIAGRLVDGNRSGERLLVGCVPGVQRQGVYAVAIEIEVCHVKTFLVTVVDADQPGRALPRLRLVRRSCIRMAAEPG